MSAYHCGYVQHLGVRFAETASRTVATRQWGVVSAGYRVSVFKDGKRSGDWFYNNVNILKNRELYT